MYVCIYLHTHLNKYTYIHIYMYIYIYICIYVVKTSSSFHIDFQETLRFDPASFAGASDFIKRTDNALRTVQPFSFPLSIQDSLSQARLSGVCVCVKHFTLERRCEIRIARKFKYCIMQTMTLLTRSKWTILYLPPLIQIRFEMG